ncbi:unnamed protein product [Macrosiphum euphorbiae]|uniref:Uncharacterized protein n=1 Tax=Macrosiphum euphorbiae TaxID=13131 RepID=A0AAV0XYS2_9HEMI|nr:unnamed protein product [Macrosiphum euphorbiae]
MFSLDRQSATLFSFPALCLIMKSKSSIFNVNLAILADGIFKFLYYCRLMLSENTVNFRPHKNSLKYVILNTKPKSSRVVDDYVFSESSTFRDAYPMGLKLLVSSGCSSTAPRPIMLSSTVR